MGTGQGPCPIGVYQRYIYLKKIVFCGDGSLHANERNEDMRLPSPQAPNSWFVSVLQDAPKTLGELALKTKAFRRGVRVKTPEQLFQVVLLYCGLDHSLREVAAIFTLLFAEITHKAIYDRLLNCGNWIELLIVEMLEIDPEALPAGQRRVLLVDATTIQACAGRGIQYRIHLCMDLMTQRFVEFSVTDKHGGESLQNFSFQEGDIVVGDRGYCRLMALLKTFWNRVDIVVRLHYNNVPLYNRNATPLNLIKRLRGQPFETIQSFEVLALSPKNQKIQTPLCAWLHCYRLSRKQANEARRKRKQHDQHKNGKVPQKDTLFLCGFFMVLTTLPPEKLSAKNVLELYRARWQIELGIKRLKSILHIDRIRHKCHTDLGPVWIRGKLLYALLLEKRIRRILGEQWLAFDTDRVSSMWGPYKMFKSHLDLAIRCVPDWAEEAWKRAFTALRGHPSPKRPLQRLPKEVFEFRSVLSSPPLAKTG